MDSLLLLRATIPTTYPFSNREGNTVNRGPIQNVTHTQQTAALTHYFKREGVRGWSLDIWNFYESPKPNKHFYSPVWRNYSNSSSLDSQNRKHSALAPPFLRTSKSKQNYFELGKAKQNNNKHIKLECSKQPLQCRVLVVAPKSSNGTWD